MPLRYTPIFTVKMKNILFIVFFLFGLSVNAQLGIWNEVGVDKKLGKKFELKADVQSRMNSFDWPPDQYIGELGLAYEFFKNADITAYYRYAQKRKEKKDGSIELNHFHRFYADLSYKAKFFKPVYLGYRLRYQRQFRDDASNFITDGNYWRNKLEVSYKTKFKLEPSVSVDIFLREGAGYDQSRWKLGLDYELLKRQKLGVYYVMDLSPLQAKQNRISLNYNFKLK